MANDVPDWVNPGSITTTTVYQSTLGPNATGPRIDISAYQSVVIELVYQSGASTLIAVDYSQSDTFGDTLMQDILMGASTIIGVKGPFIQLTNRVANTVSVTVIGSTRPAPTILDYADSGVNLPARFLKLSGAMTAGNVYQMPLASPSSVAWSHRGQVFLHASMDAGTAAKGHVDLNYTDDGGIGRALHIFDTGEMHAEYTGGPLFLYRLAALPLVPLSFAFTCDVAGTSGVDMFLIAL